MLRQEYLTTGDQSYHHGSNGNLTHAKAESSYEETQQQTHKYPLNRTKKGQEPPMRRSDTGAPSKGGETETGFEQRRSKRAR